MDTRYYCFPADERRPWLRGDSEYFRAEFLRCVEQLKRDLCMISIEGGAWLDENCVYTHKWDEVMENLKRLARILHGMSAFLYPEVEADIRSLSLDLFRSVVDAENLVTHIIFAKYDFEQNVEKIQQLLHARCPPDPEGRFDCVHRRDTMPERTWNYEIVRMWKDNDRLNWKRVETDWRCNTYDRVRFEKAPPLPSSTVSQILENMPWSSCD